MEWSQEALRRHLRAQMRRFQRECRRPWLASLRPTVRWGGACGRSHCRSAGRWRGSRGHSPSTGVQGGAGCWGISWSWCRSRHGENARPVCVAVAVGCCGKRQKIHRGLPCIKQWLSTGNACSHGTARTWHRTVRAQRVAAGMAWTPGAAPCAGRHIAGAQAAVSAPGMVSLSATSNCCIWAWLITPSSSATTPMGLPLAIAVLAIWAALS